MCGVFWVVLCKIKWIWDKIEDNTKTSIMSSPKTEEKERMGLKKIGFRPFKIFGLLLMWSNKLNVLKLFCIF